MLDAKNNQLEPQYIEDNVDAFTFRISNECGAKN